MGWLLLARIIERCSPQCLRLAQSRLAKKLVLVKNEPTIYGGIFFRQLLVRNPQVGNLHADVVHSIITRFIDLTISFGDEILRYLLVFWRNIRISFRETVCYPFILIFDVGHSYLFLFDKCSCFLGVLHLKSFGVSSSRDDLCILLFELYSSSLSGSSTFPVLSFVLRDDIMSVLEAGLNDLQLREAALGTVRSLCTNGKTAFLSVIPQIVTILISKLDTPSEALFDTLTHICRVYGPGSTLFRHFYAIYSTLRHPLDEQDYGPSAGGFLSTVIQTSSFLIKPEVSILMSVQRKISEEVVLNPNSSVYRDLLASFLSCTHELVPPPVQIARTVISRCSDASCVQTLNCLCDTITRPRMQVLH
uniref:Serine/threonine-protein kinase ATR n=1 Tax=Angiostrongylus cantonensis TaxID=6313 RepID=A0A158P8Q6_ANGCA